MPTFLVAKLTAALAGGLCLLGLLVSTLPAAAPAPVMAPKPDPNHKPTVFLIGDSTVKNGQDNGSNGQWGWGHILPYYFDKEKVTVENDAVGGTSSRSFMKTPNMWPRVLAKLQPGDYVIMQFGHNDNTAAPDKDTLRYRSTLPGNGEDTVQGLVQGGGTETVYSFGWYIRKYIAETKAKGATPIVCSLIPRNGWSNGKKNRNSKDYGLWAKEAAEQAHAAFIPLNELVADEYDKLGQAAVTATMFPPGESTHPTWAGAKLNAAIVAQGIKSLKDLPLKDYLVADPKAPDAPDVVAGGGGAGRGRRGGATTATAPAAQ